MEVRRSDQSKQRVTTPAADPKGSVNQAIKDQQTQKVVSEGETTSVSSAQAVAAKSLTQAAVEKKADPRSSGSVAGALIDRKAKEKAEQSWKKSTARSEAASSPGASVRPSGKKHTVAEGDTLSGIARQYGTSVLDLIAVNPGVNFADLQPGQQIELPQPRGQSLPSTVEQGGAAALQQLQQAAGTLPPPRKLDPAEIAGLQKIFGSSVDYSKVEIVEGNLGVLGTLSQGRAFTLGNTIYVPGVLKTRDPDGALLAHETVHVWQYQSSGAGYITSSIWARATQGEQAAYSWQKDVDSGKAWHELSSEQQGQLIEDAVKAKFFNNPGSTFSVGGTDYTKYLNTALGHIARGEGAP
jgi:LysM repeat protein